MYANTTINDLVVYVVQEIPVPNTLGISLFKSNQTGNLMMLRTISKGYYT